MSEGGIDDKVFPRLGWGVWVHSDSNAGTFCRIEAKTSHGHVCPIDDRIEVGFKADQRGGRDVIRVVIESNEVMDQGNKNGFCPILHFYSV